MGVSDNKRDLLKEERINPLRSILTPLVRLLLLALMAIVTTGCNRDSDNGSTATISKRAADTITRIQYDTESLLKDTTSALESITPSSEQVSPERALEELKKLRQFEYQVLQFSRETTSAEIELKLNELGKNFWECFDTVQRPATQNSQVEDAKLLVFCRRRPETPLRFVPSNFLGK